MASEYELPLVINGLEALTTFGFNCANSLAYKSFLTQEMLKHHFLTGSLFYPSICHTTEIVDEFFSNLKTIFSTIKDCEQGRDISSLLAGPPCHDGFKRLN